ncbi:MAG: c-type cytochrome, partial [candidate division NC10 bacterium]|nr:c-type cytochrome [candidate division NC10 bacterium]
MSTSPPWRGRWWSSPADAERAGAPRDPGSAPALRGRRAPGNCHPGGIHLRQRETWMVWRTGLLLAMVVLPAAGTGPEASGAGAKRAEGLFRQYCAVCHGAAGKGDGPNAPYLDETQPRDLTDRGYMARLSDDHLFRVIAEGGRAVDRSPFMPPFGKTLFRKQLGSLVSYVRRLSAEPPPPAGAAGGIEAAGARLVAELGCAGCHQIGGLQAAPIAPDLRRLGSKIRVEWLVQFLQAPRRVRPAGYVPLSRSRMPDFRLSR